MFGVLKYYDLADLSAAADTSSLLVLAPTDSLWRPQSADAAAQAFTFTSKVRGNDKTCTVMPDISPTLHTPAKHERSPCLGLLCTGQDVAAGYGRVLGRAAATGIAVLASYIVAIVNSAMFCGGSQPSFSLLDYPTKLCSSFAMGVKTKANGDQHTR